MTYYKNSYAANLLSKIENKSARVTVMGMGYVGLPLLLEILNAGYNVTGFDPDKSRIDAIKANKSYIKDVSDSSIKSGWRSGRFSVTDNPTIMRKSDIV